MTDAPAFYVVPANLKPEEVEVFTPFILFRTIQVLVPEGLI